MSASNERGQLWFTDRITENERHRHRIKKWIVRKRSKFQTMGIAESISFGRCLVIDNDLQSCENDEFIYHEALVHPAMILHGKPRRVLILGGGEGATLREVLKYRTVEKVTMVDIDSSVIEISKRYLPKMSAGAFNDKRTDVVIGDARVYLEETREQFDVIISDLSSPIEGGPAYLLYTQEFYKKLRRKLAPRGIFSAQVDSCNLTNVQVPTAICRTLGTVFREVKLYTCYIPSFDALWGFALATDYVKQMDISKEEIDKRVKKLVAGNLELYDGETHAGIFSLPKYVREELGGQESIITEKNPVFIYK